MRTTTTTKGRVAALAGLLVLAGALPALGAPPEEGYDPVLRTERVYFHCAGTGPVHDSVSNGAVPWNTSAPALSVTEGGGCTSPDNPLQGNNQQSVQDTHFAGTYTGNLDTLTVDLHTIYAGRARTGGTLTFNVRLEVDGVPRLGPDGRDVAVVPDRSAYFINEAVSVSVQGLGLLSRAEDTEHTVLLTVSGGAVAAPNGANPVRDTLSAWVYDTTEVPAGITFAPAQLGPVRVTATPPPPVEQG